MPMYLPRHKGAQPPTNKTEKGEYAMDRHRDSGPDFEQNIDDQLLDGALRLGWGS